MKEIILRDYQKECIEIINNMESGTGLVHLFTGAGKTVTFAHIPRKGRMLILSHRDELVHQPQKYFDCSFGVEQAKETSNGEEVISASVQTLIHRLEKFKPNEFDMIITDEAHHAAAPSYRKIFDYFKPRLHIGFTATPNRGDKVRLDDIYEKIIFSRDLKWGIKNNYLTDINCLRITASYNLKKVKKQMGDYITHELAKKVDNPIVNKQIKEAYDEYAKGQTLIFAINVNHANHLHELIPNSAVITGDTPNRKEIINQFEEGKIKCIINCMVLTEGTDLPCIETIIIARPTMNASLYTQMVGRGVRLYPGKKYLTLIDIVGVSDNLELCTAPTLFGYDLKKIPEDKQKNVKGMLTQMQEIIDMQYDIPKVWILNTKYVNLFSEENNVNLHNINWISTYDNGLYYEFLNKDNVQILPLNVLGRTSIIWIKNNQVRKLTDLSLQQALDYAQRVFNEFYINEKALWDKTISQKWNNRPITEKQINFIKNICDSNELKDINLSDLTQEQASFIISRAKILKNN